ncbi:MAG: hypothetical protein FJX71_00465 [Alphaproteobacteria bacterium]|nr:hypothetical protein [Alphaproteobacteria bacterium]
MESELILSRGGFPPLSARGCIQNLIPIESGLLRRTINGSLIYVGKESGHKYRSIISCEDKASLALEGFWRGSEVRVGCIQRLWQKVSGQEAHLERDPIEGSLFAVTQDRKNIEIKEVSGRKVAINKKRDEVIFLSYRPWLNMRVIVFTLTTNEWGLKAGWKLELEEI